jgi:hypothetical protein
MNDPFFEIRRHTSVYVGNTAWSFLFVVFFPNVIGEWNRGSRPGAQTALPVLGGKSHVPQAPKQGPALVHSWKLVLE